MTETNFAFHIKFVLINLYYYFTQFSKFCLIFLCLEHIVWSPLHFLVNTSIILQNGQCSSYHNHLVILLYAHTLCSWNVFWTQFRRFWFQFRWGQTVLTGFFFFSSSSALREKFKEATVTFSHIPNDSSFTVELPYLSVLPQRLVKDHEITE
jgi:hypothetical protein